ncbi:hypothetical protein HMPREF3185_00201 [Porphyromonas somerae]|uniref:Uncharacterized protein n=1 Tax=Porphyromonas somerae TaxID=322095 RepID=A0A134BED7_9PORP|nr:hypothetical protein HMPREF3184_00201 [Porphyromonadaceae bacterium KA00676]KXB78323.1 hypothetical protein HMPREF3185_00201 [Porphyromonas somerae]
MGLSKGTSRHFVTAGGAGQVGRVELCKDTINRGCEVSRLAFPWAMSLASGGCGEGAFACFPRAYLLY